jgi:phosphatidylglycerol:prolipoprotein diacylglycerol transferase
MYPVILEIGPVTLYSYGLMMALGFLSAGYLTGLELDRKGYDGQIASSLLLWAAIGGIGGARLLAIANDPGRLVADPIGSVFSASGFIWYGGLLGGLAAVSWAIRKHHLPWRLTTDCIAPGLVLAHGIGRIGCQLAGDGDWGQETTLPWGMAYPNAIVGWDKPDGVFVHPTPVYEMLAYFLVFAFLWARRKKDYPPGQLFWWYLVLGPGARFFIEFVRINPPVLAGLTQAQLTSIALVSVGLYQLCKPHFTSVVRGAEPS